MTRRKRKLKSKDQSAALAAGAPGISALFGPGFQQQIMKMMQSMMEAMLGKMMESFFGGGGQWSSGAAPMANPKGKGKGSMGEFSGAAPASGGPGKGEKAQDADYVKGKPKGKDGKGGAMEQDVSSTREVFYAKGKAKGKDNHGGGGGADRANPKGSRLMNRWAKDKGGPGASGTLDSKGKGKGKSTSEEKGLDKAVGGEWETIVWQAKPAALGCARLVTSIDSLEAALEGTDKILVQVTAEDFNEAASIMLGGCPQGSVLVKDGEDCQTLEQLRAKWPVEHKHVPGVIGGGPRLRKVWVCTFGSPAALSPALDFVKAPAPQRRRHEDTVVLRCVAWGSFADRQDFQALLKRPGRAVRAWYAKVAPLNSQEFIDSWGWQSHDDTQVRGLVRLTKEAALTALRSSGSWANGVALFFTALDWSTVDVCEAPALLWVDKEQGEAAKDYVQRVRKEAVAHGLHCGGDRLAVRLDQLDPRILPQRSVWHLRGARQEWLCEDIEGLLQSSGFTEIIVEAKLLRRGQPVWEFKGKRQDFREFVPIELN